MFRRDQGNLERQIWAMAIQFTDKPDSSVLVMCPNENQDMANRIKKTLSYTFGIDVNVEKVSNTGRSYGHMDRPLPAGNFVGYRFTTKKQKQ